MGKTNPRVQNGTGPAKGSYQATKVGVGKRQIAGVKCPKKGRKR